MDVLNRGCLYFVRLLGKIILLFCVFSYVYQIHYKIFPVTLVFYMISLSIKVFLKSNCVIFIFFVGFIWLLYL